MYIDKNTREVKLGMDYFNYCFYQYYSYGIVSACFAISFANAIWCHCHTYI